MDYVSDSEPITSPIDVPDKWIHFVDDNVLAKLPAGSKISGIFPHGNSYWCGWTRTAEIRTEQEYGSELSFFLKVTQNDEGKAMMWQEYLSMTKLHDIVPYLTPTPIAWGNYATNPNIHFFLSEFVEMTDDIPEASSFMAAIADLHTKGLSPNGKYGFPVPTFQRAMPQYTEWTDSWEEFFSNSIKRVFEFEERTHGSDPEIQALEKAILTKVIPRLLRPLETGGRSIQPRLIHGDIWDGNVSTRVENDQPVIYDASCIYAHHEAELAPMRCVRHQMGKSYIKAYFRHFPISAPEEDQEDRIKLYCLRWEMNGSAFGNPRLRNIAIEMMKELVKKYPDGYEGWAKENGEEVIVR